jgi:hypothetical protein
MKELEKLIQVAKDEWPDEQWAEMGILKAEEELRALNGVVEVLTKHLGEVDDVCPPEPRADCIEDCRNCWEIWARAQVKA